jgi:putative cell wall-binding protein
VPARTMIPRLLAATFAVTVLAVIPAGAITTNVLEDPNDVDGPVDITKVTRTDEGDIFTFAVETDGGFPLTADDFWLVEIAIDVNGDKNADYVAAALNFDSDVIAFVTTGTPRALEAGGSIAGSTLTLAVPKSAIGNASSFDWEAHASYFNEATDVATTDDAPTQWTIDPPLNPVRAAGPDRIETAIQSCFNLDHTAGAVVLARSDDFADALAGGPLAAIGAGCVLLTPSNQLDPRVFAEIQRVLGPGGFVFLLGGEAALGPAVKAKLDQEAIPNVRVAGANRFETALAIADGLEAAFGEPAAIFIATGTLFPDALSASAAAASLATEGAAPIVLTNGTSLPPAVATYLAEHPTTTKYAVGGPAAAAVPTATPIVGGNRYETAVNVAEQFFSLPDILGFASGVNFPDALAGGAMIGQFGGPLLLTDPTTLTPETADYTSQHADALGIVFGGPAAVSNGVRDAIDAILVDDQVVELRAGQVADWG